MEYDESRQSSMGLECTDRGGIQKKPRKSERQNDDYPYKELASQHDMDVF